MRGAVFRRLAGANFEETLRQFAIPQKHPANLPWKAVDEVLTEPVKYYLELPGKRVRPALLQLAANLLQLSPPALPWLKCYVEMLHNASLVLDDIQDGSELRRGRPCAHILHGLDRAATASLAALALDCQENLLARVPGLTPSTELGLRRVHAHTLRQLLVGVALDVRWHGHTTETPPPSLADYFAMVRMKTAALMTGGLNMLGLWAEKGDPRREAIGRAFECYAQAFQVHDDLLNIEEGPYQDLKGFGEDVREGKLSYVVVRMSNEPVRSAECSRLLGILDAPHKGEAEVAEAMRILRSSPYVAQGRRLCAALAEESRQLLRQAFPDEGEALADWEEVLETSFGAAHPPPTAGEPGSFPRKEGGSGSVSAL